jgi:fatty-acyl-CoA synthase
MKNIYQQDLDKNSANFAALTPLSFFARAASLYPDATAIVHGELNRSWAQMYRRCVAMAAALAKHGIGVGDTVAVMLPNIPEMFEAHFFVPMSGAVLNAINTRLDAATVAFILTHAEAKVLFTDREFAPVVKAALALLKDARLKDAGREHDLLVVDVEDPLYADGELLGSMTYDQLLGSGDPAYHWQLPADEWDAISLNYTSGTTGNPKGVVYHHRGAYLNAVNNALTWEMGMHPRYLWTLPMFHCNGWCFPWTLAVTVGTTVCLRHVREDAVFTAFREQGVTHFCGAPVVLNTLVNAPQAMHQGINQPHSAHPIKVMTAGAAPPAAVIEGMENLGFEVIQVYGLTETYGPMIVSAWRSEWDNQAASARAALKARQGIVSILGGAVMVADPQTLVPVPWDGVTQGEIFMRGNIVMKGYLKNPATTAEAFAGGWFHSGDLAVCHADGYIQIKDRSKDIIISGGENISSIEVEDTLFKHPKILEAAVVARQDPKWGEHPCAFVTLKPGADMKAAEVMAYCKTQLAGFKVPKTVVFGPLTKTSTGKVQKYLLRQQAEALGNAG